VVLSSVTGDDDEVEDSVGAAEERAELSTNPLDTEPFRDRTTVFDGSTLLGGLGAWRFFAGWVVCDAGLPAGACGGGLDLTADVATMLPLPIPVDTTGTYDFLHCSCVNLSSLGIYIQT